MLSCCGRQCAFQRKFWRSLSKDFWHTNTHCWSVCIGKTKLMRWGEVRQNTSFDLNLHSTVTFDNPSQQQSLPGSDWIPQTAATGGKHQANGQQNPKCSSYLVFRWTQIQILECGSNILREPGPKNVLVCSELVPGLPNDGVDDIQARHFVLWLALWTAHTDSASGRGSMR